MSQVIRVVRIYASPYGVFKVSLIGYTFLLQSLDEEKKWALVDAAECICGYVNKVGDIYSFAKDKKDTYLMKKTQGKNIPQAMKIENQHALSDAWKKRIGKTYIVCDATRYDIAIGQMLMAITIEEIEEVEGAITLFAHYRKGGFSDNGMRQLLIPTDDQIADSILRTPSNGSRDLIHAIFETKDGKNI